MTMPACGQSLNSSSVKIVLKSSSVVFLCAPLPQRFHYIVRIFPGDELARHSRDVPAQYPAAHPRNNARETNAGVNDRGEAIANTGEIFFEMLQNIARSAKRREYIYKAKHLHLEMLIAH